MTPSQPCALLHAGPKSSPSPCMVRRQCSPSFCQRAELRERQACTSGLGSWAAPRAPTAAVTKLTGNFSPIQDNTSEQRSISPTQQSADRVINVYPITLLGYLPELQLQTTSSPLPAQDTTPSHQSRARVVLMCPQSTQAPTTLPHNPCDQSSTSCSCGPAARRPRAPPATSPVSQTEPGTATLAGGPSFSRDASLHRFPFAMQPSARPLDPAGTAHGADGQAAACLARKCLRNKGSSTAKSSRTQLHAVLSTNTQVEIKSCSPKVPPAWKAPASTLAVRGGGRMVPSASNRFSSWTSPRSSGSSRHCSSWPET